MLFFDIVVTNVNIWLYMFCKYDSKLLLDVMEVQLFSRISPFPAKAITHWLKWMSGES